MNAAATGDCDMILRPREISSKPFTISPRDPNHWVAEISDLGPNFQFERVYDDACDVGFTLISSKTGKGVVFALEAEERNRDGDILMWHFVSVTPGHKNKYKITLFND